jgi:hypothetical protein
MKSCQEAETHSLSRASIGYQVVLMRGPNPGQIIFHIYSESHEYIFKSDIIEVPELDFSEYRVFNCLVCQDISRANQATKRANKSINQAVKRMQWGDIRDKVMWAQEEQRHLSTHAEEFACYLTDLIEAFSPDLSEPSNIVGKPIRNYADSLTKMADDIDKMVEINSRIVRKSLGMQHYHFDMEGGVDDIADEKTTPSADAVPLW